jgi:GxxExxY protein
MTKNVDRGYLNQLSSKVIGAAIEVHRIMGPGLLESVYQECLMDELESRGVAAAQQVESPLYYKGKLLRDRYRMDVVVEESLLVEIKAVESLAPIHEAQVLTYLRLSDFPLGLLINFNATALVKGLRRLVHRF